MSILTNTIKIISCTWRPLRLILDAGKVQIGRSHSNMISCISKFLNKGLLVFLISKILSGHLEASKDQGPGPAASRCSYNFLI